MSDRTLRNQVIHLAHANPGPVRDALLPLLSKSAGVAETILAQIGGRRAMTMIGGKDLVSGPNKLQFGFSAKARNGINKIVIVLDLDDTYTVEFWKLRGTNTTKVKDLDMVYAEDLARVIQDVTGLALRL